MCRIEGAVKGVKEKIRESEDQRALWQDVE